jgi:recombination protein RecA
LKSAALLRNEIADSLSARIPAALSMRVRAEPERVPCGLAALDALLRGGLPEGTLTEFIGAEGSGRTSAALAYAAATTRDGNVCAWIDVSNALSPENAAANGIELERLLWVRCEVPPEGTPVSEEFRNTPGIVQDSSIPPRNAGGGSPHPRSEGRDMPQAIASMLTAHGGLHDHQIAREKRREKRFIGTPGAPNRPLEYRVEKREEQVAFDRLPPRRGENLAIAPRCAEPLPRRTPSLPSGDRLYVERPASPDPFKTGTRETGKRWQALDQALRATDLLLQNGGFSLIVLDLGSTPPEQAWRIPMATWFRFRAACERTRVSLLLLTQHPCARSSAELVVRMETGQMITENTVMTGIRFSGMAERTRRHDTPERVVSIRKPPQPERPGTWTSEASWARTR